MVEDPAETLRLRSVTLKPAYDSNDDLLADFYIPVLRASTSYDRSVGYFRSSALAARGRLADAGGAYAHGRRIAQRSRSGAVAPRAGAYVYKES